MAGRKFQGNPKGPTGGDDVVAVFETEILERERVMTLVIDSSTYDGNPHGALVFVNNRQVPPEDLKLEITYRPEPGLAWITEAQLEQSEEAPTDAGTYNVEATYDGITATGTLTIYRAPLAVVAESRVIAYGDTVPGSLTAVVYGAQDRDVLTATATATLTDPTGNPVPTGSPVPAGHYAIIANPPVPTNANGSLNNYAAPVYVSGTLTVTPLPLVVVAGSASIQAGAAIPPSFPATVYGNLNSDKITATATAAVTSGNLGPYSIIASDPVAAKGVLDNYAAPVYVPGTLTITQIPLSDPGAAELFHKVLANVKQAASHVAALHQEFPFIQAGLADVSYQAPKPPAPKEPASGPASTWLRDLATDIDKVISAVDSNELKSLAHNALSRLRQFVGELAKEIDEQRYGAHAGATVARTASVLHSLAADIDKFKSAVDSNDTKHLAVKMLNQLHQFVLKLAREIEEPPKAAHREVPAEWQKYQINFPGDMKFPLPPGDHAQVLVFRPGEREPLETLPAMEKRGAETGFVDFSAKQGHEYELVAMFNEFVIQTIRIPG